jgi:hypothetical protein
MKEFKRRMAELRWADPLPETGIGQDAGELAQFECWSPTPTSNS